MTVREESLLLPTHLLVPAGPVPTALDPDGVYPYESYLETSRRPVLKRYRMVVLENSHLRAWVCPDLGGRLWALEHLPSGRDCLFRVPVVRPVRILPRYAFIGGGLELSFPISHTPSLLEPVDCRIDVSQSRTYVSCGERELHFGMNWTVEYSLGEGEPFLIQRSRFRNPTTERHPWMSWSNAGVPTRPDTEFHFPGGPVLAHSASMRTLDWRTQGPRRQADVTRMTGFFWSKPDVGAFGVFTPSLGCGLYHTADLEQVPGIKLWSDGVGPHQAWVDQYTCAAESCVEIQAGPLADQSIKAVLEPEADQSHTEFWFPTDSPLDLQKLSPPRIALRSTRKIPLFSWSHPRAKGIWSSLLKAHHCNCIEDAPPPPDEDSNDWAPSGMQLEEALDWAAKTCALPGWKDRWLFQKGAWLAGRKRLDEALDTLEASNDGRAWILAARIQRRERGKFREASALCRRVRGGLALHPQFVVEFDRCLTGLGEEGFEERRNLMDSVAALNDEWLAERRAALRLDMGDALGALQILESTHFQLVHQRYERQRMWRKARMALGLEQEAPEPNWLGEDDLAEFGAYREYAED